MAVARVCPLPWLMLQSSVGHYNAGRSVPQMQKMVVKTVRSAALAMFQSHSLFPVPCKQQEAVATRKLLSNEMAISKLSPVETPSRHGC